MTREQAIDVLNMVEAHGIADRAKEKAIKCIELIGHLNNRPCEACEFHGENGCSKWTCVFDEMIYEKHNK